MVPKVGVEPTRGRPQRFLRPSRLPFRHFGVAGHIIAESRAKVKLIRPLFRARATSVDPSPYPLPCARERGGRGVRADSARTPAVVRFVHRQGMPVSRGR